MGLILIGCYKSLVIDMEEEKLFTYRYARPALGVDCLVLRQAESVVEVLLIQRGNAPFKGEWAFPGGFFDMDDADVAATASRELEEETGLTVPLTLLGVFSAKDRDPRERIISCAYYGYASLEQVPIAADDAAAVGWFNLRALPAMAFDHGEMAAKLVALLKGEGG
jgi:8-oxo-dGTP diphosphatase